MTSLLVSTPFGSISFVPGCGWVNSASQNGQTGRSKRRNKEKDEKPQIIDKK